jgi:hypothetical protein
MSHSSLAMPHPLEVPALIETYKENIKAGRGRLADDVLRGHLDRVMAGGAALALALALDEEQSQPADVDLDTCWGGTKGLIVSMERMCTRRGPTPLTPEEVERAQRASRLLQHWIGGDLRFLKLRYIAQWRESDLRLKRLDEPMAQGMETPRQAMSGLGLEWALARLVAAHTTYGRTLGLGTATDDAALAAWEADLERLILGVKYHHADDPTTLNLFIAPYDAALEEGLTRRRHAKDLRSKRAAKDTAKDTAKAQPDSAPDTQP